MPKSLVQFVRKGVGLKGYTEHSGRGAWIMYSNDDLSVYDKLKRIRKKVEEWQEAGIIESWIIDRESDGTPNSYMVQFDK